MNALDGYADQIKAMAADGLSDARIAAELPIDTDDQKVYRWRKKHGVDKIVRHVSRLDPYAADIRRMYVEEGLTDERIAGLLPVSANIETIRAFRIKKLGIPSDRNRKVGRFTRTLATARSRTNWLPLGNVASAGIRSKSATSVRPSV